MKAAVFVVVGFWDRDDGRVGSHLVIKPYNPTTHEVRRVPGTRPISRAAEDVGAY